MDYPHVRPSLERLWRDEVLYLHSLWHQSSSSSPNPNPNPSITPNTRSRPRANVGPSTPATAFKKTKQNQKKKKKKTKKKREPIPDGDSQPSEIEWPCPPPPNQNPGPTGWPDLAPPPSSAPPPSAEEQARLAALAAQRNGLRASHEFFSKEGSSSDEDEDEDDESTCFAFFVGLFEKDAELRVYYEKSAEKGKFSCLVCRGIGEKKRRRFNDCVALVQHSHAISKTKRRGAHRGFGRAVCWVLGWDINRLPSIVLDLGEPLGWSLAKDATPQKDSVAGTKDDLQDKAELVGTNNGELMEYTEEINNKDVLNKEVAKGELLDEVIPHVEAQQENECTETSELRDIPTDLSSEDDDESEDGSDV